MIYRNISRRLNEYSSLKESVNDDYKDVMEYLQKCTEKPVAGKLKRLIASYVGILNSQTYISELMFENCEASYSRGVLNVDVEHVKKGYGDHDDAYYDYTLNLFVPYYDKLRHNPEVKYVSADRIDRGVLKFLGLHLAKGYSKDTVYFSSYYEHSMLDNFLRVTFSDVGSKKFAANDDALLFKKIVIHEHVFYD